MKIKRAKLILVKVLGTTLILQIMTNIHDISLFLFLFMIFNVEMVITHL